MYLKTNNSHSVDGLVISIDQTQVMSSRNREITAKDIKPHRCNDRVEDMLEVGGAEASTHATRHAQAIGTLEWSDKVVPAWKMLRACFKSEPG